MIPVSMLTPQSTRSKPNIMDLFFPLGCTAVTMIFFTIGILQTQRAWLKTPHECAPASKFGDNQEWDDSWKESGLMCYGMWKDPSTIAMPSGKGGTSQVYRRCYGKACLIYCVDHDCDQRNHGRLWLLAAGVFSILCFWFTAWTCIKILRYKYLGHRDADEVPSEDEEEGLE